MYKIIINAPGIFCTLCGKRLIERIIKDIEINKIKVDSINHRLIIESEGYINKKRIIEIIKKDDYCFNKHFDVDNILNQIIIVKGGKNKNGG